MGINQNPYVGIAPITKALKEAAKTSDKALAEIVKRKAQEYVPKDSHDLKNSAGKRRVKDDQWIVFFDEEYAAVQHEGKWVTGPLAGVEIKNYTTSGTGSKYLEKAIKEVADEYPRLVAGEIKKIKNIGGKGSIGGKI